MGILTVACKETAQAVLEYFNGFHDGFMKRIVIRSQDRIDEDLSQTCTGLFDVEIEFAHYNYAAEGAPFHPHDQIIRGQFRDVRDIRLTLTEEFLGNTIISLRMEPTEDGRLELHLGRHAYVAGERRYDFRESPLFSFTSADFTEMT